jgi:hypothetical protein
MKKIIYSFALIILSNFNYSQIFVDINATGSDDGSSWANAYTDLQDALDAVNADYQEVWVKLKPNRP